MVKLPYNPPIPLPGIEPRELKTYVHTKIKTKMFTAALFITAKSRNNPNAHQLTYAGITCAPSTQRTILRL